MRSTTQFREQHLGFFLRCEPVSQGAVGSVPKQWVDKVGLTRVPDRHRLPKTKLDRDTLKVIFKNEDPLFAYACAMAWGGQGARDGGKNARRAWQSRRKIAEKISQLRKGALTPAAMYSLFSVDGIGGLGPAYFTKLIAFQHPLDSAFIMDQWTAKSINLLLRQPLIRLTNHTVHAKNSPATYEAFCQTIAELSRRTLETPWNSDPWQIEERLFSKGGRRRAPWRNYVHLRSAASTASNVGH